MSDLRDSFPPLMTADHVAELLDVHANTIYEAVKRGEIEAVRIGRLLRFPRDRVLRQLGLLDTEATSENVVALRAS